MKLITTTDRLIVREFEASDAAFIIALLNSPGWLRFIGDRNIKTIAGAEEYLFGGPFKSYAQHGFGLYCVCLKSNDQPIGMSGILKRDTLDATDLGFAFLPEHEGKGYGFEVSEALLEFAKNDLGLNRMLAITSKDNDRSTGLLKRLGFVLKDTIILPNDTEELFLFELTML